jgi:hypothetical protein
MSRGLLRLSWLRDYGQRRTMKLYSKKVCDGFRATLLKQQWEKRATKCYFRVCMEKLPNIHEINTFWRAISIHRRKTV